MHVANVLTPIVAVLTAMQGTEAPIIAKVAGVAAKAAAKGIAKGMAGKVLTSGHIGTAVGIGGFACSIATCNPKKVRSEPRFVKVKKSGLIGRDDRPAPPEGVNEHDWNNCYDSLAGVTLNINGPVGNGDSIEVTGLTIQCMPLIAFFLGNPADNDIIPITCGDTCVQYANLSEDDYNWVKEVFEVFPTL